MMIVIRFLWGDEVEYLIVQLNPNDKTVRLRLIASKLLSRLSKVHQSNVAQKLTEPDGHDVVFHPEYGQFMIETTPGQPYGGFTAHIPLVESNMMLRRHLMHVRPHPRGQHAPPTYSFIKCVVFF